MIMETLSVTSAFAPLTSEGPHEPAVTWKLDVPMLLFH
jgi:hypothetical protein